MYLSTDYVQNQPANHIVTATATAVPIDIPDNTVTYLLQWQTEISDLTRSRSCEHYVRAQHSSPRSKMNFIVGFDILLPKYNVNLDSTKSEKSATPLFDLIPSSTRFVRRERCTVREWGFSFLPLLPFE